MEGGAGADEDAVDVAGEIGAGVCRDGQGTEVGDAHVEAEGFGGGPALVGEAAFFAAEGAVDGEPRLGVEGGGAEGEQKEGEGPETTDHASRVAVSDGAA